MSGTRVSCIVPAFDAERYLPEALESIRAQTHPPFEILVVDDGSRDATAEVAGRYPEVRLLRQRHAGCAAARNAGLAEARGDFVAWLDADDLWLPEKLERQLARFARRPELDLSVTHYQNFWVAELADEARRYRGHPLTLPSWGYVVGTLLTRRSLFGKAGVFDAEKPEAADSLWFLRVLEQGAALEVLPDLLMRRRFHARNTTRLDKAGASDAILRFAKARLDARRRRGAATRS